jgi:PKD repeat protein
MHHRSFSCGALAVCVSSGLALAQYSLVVPNGYATQAENSANAFPYANNTATYPGLRIQTVYDSTHFSDQGVWFPVVITGVRLRAQDLAATSTWVGGTYNNSTVNLSTASVDHLATTNNYATNHGADLLTVYNGPVVVQAGAGNGLNVPGPFHIDVQFPGTPFTYNPGLGDFCCEFDQPSPGTNWVPNAAGTGFTALASVATSPVPPFPSNARRVYGSTLYPNANGVDTSILVMEVQYAPTPGLYATFRANVTGGGTPLAVNFLDQSITDDPAGITSWAWDLDGDSIIDSNLQNPSFVYQNCGSYNVTLTVTDGTHPPSTWTRTAYIVTDIVTPSFTTALIGPGTLQFTDTSSPTPTSWAWDLDGDNIVDSTAQNPTWLYAGNCVQTNVTLTVNRLCRGPFTLTRPVSSSSFLETLRDGNTSTSTGAGNYFDVNVLDPAGISICRMETKTTTTANVAVTFNVFVTPNTYVGANTNLARWRLVGSAATVGIAAATALETVTFNPPIYLPAGSYGVHVQVVGFSPQYTSVPGPTVFSNSDLSITVGGAGVLGGTLIANRAWNGSFSYTGGTGQVAGYGFFQAGCAGSMGMSNLLHTSRPQLGTTLTVNATNLPLSVAIMMVGFSRTASAFGPLPLDATPFGAPGCFGRVSPDATAFLFGAGNVAAWNFGVPNNAGLIGILLYTQSLVPDPAFNTLGAVFGDAAAVYIGN